MFTPTTTTTQLLDSLHDARNDAAWMALDARFRGIIEGVAVRLGLSHTDAADVAQATLTEFFEGYRRHEYERGKGRLRTWILMIARRRAIDLLRRRGRAHVIANSEQLDGESATETVLHAWELEEERVAYQRAMDMLRQTSRSDPVTIRAFELVAVQGMSVDAAAAECKLTPEQVYLAKHRTLTRLREIAGELMEAYDKDE